MGQQGAQPDNDRCDGCHALEGNQNMDSMEMAMDWSIIFVLELLFSWLRRPHPMVAHFPIAFFPAALFSAITAGSGHLLLPPFNS